MRKFEKISFEQFKKDIKDDLELYNSYVLPKRATKFSAGYDFMAIEDILIKPGEIKKIPTGIKAKYEEDEALILITRSGFGIKNNLRLTNQVGLIDSDYYNNSKNEGHMWFSLQNEGKEELLIKKGIAYGQGFFIKYLITDDDEVSEVRNGGFGSTNKESER